MNKIIFVLFLGAVSAKKALKLTSTIRMQSVMSYHRSHSPK